MIIPASIIAILSKCPNLFHPGDYLVILGYYPKFQMKKLKFNKAKKHDFHLFKATQVVMGWRQDWNLSQPDSKT